jgi:hypothetical protein
MWLLGTTILGSQSVKAAYGDQPDWAGSAWTVQCPNDSNANADAKIQLLKCEITETTIEIAYEIINQSDHEIWVCDGIDIEEDFFAIGLDPMTHRLLVKIDINIPVINSVDWYFPPFGIYMRLSPGKKHLGSFSRSLPLRRYGVFRTECEIQTQLDVNLDRVALDIHYYDGDLPGLIRSLLTEAERFTGTLPPDWEDWPNIDRVLTYFPGLVLKEDVNGSANFDETYGKGIQDGELAMPYYNYRFLRDEKVLRLTLDGVSIPYSSGSPGP